jgi:hypothetical protein
MFEKKWLFQQGALGDSPEFLGAPPNLFSSNTGKTLILKENHFQPA